MFNIAYSVLNGNCNETFSKINPFNSDEKKANEFYQNPSEKRFYPCYGAGKRSRNTNLYKNGKTKGKNHRPTKLEREVKYSVILKNKKVNREKGFTSLYA